MAFFVVAGAILLGAGALLLKRRAISCVDAHSEEGLNYPWLDDVHGGLDHVEYEEPPGSGRWRRYTRVIWRAHCNVVRHDPDGLVAAHVRAFITPATRFARLMFIFKDGSRSEPREEFYTAEADWFRRHATA